MWNASFNTVSAVTLHTPAELLALPETRASVTPQMEEEYGRIQQTLKSDAVRPLGGIGFVLPGMLRPRETPQP